MHDHTQTPRSCAFQGYSVNATVRSLESDKNKVLLDLADALPGDQTFRKSTWQCFIDLLVQCPCRSSVTAIDLGHLVLVHYRPL